MSCDLAGANVAELVTTQFEVCSGQCFHDFILSECLQDPEEGGIVKVIDYGLSTFYHPGQQFFQVVGTAYYMPPEMCKCLTDKTVRRGAHHETFGILNISRFEH
jgi:hypothetical protein